MIGFFMNAIVVIPTYNEKDNVAALATHILKVDNSLHILFIDDNSPDGTGRIVDGLAVDSGNIHVIHRSGKMGLWTAYIEGFQ